MHISHISGAYCAGPPRFTWAVLKSSRASGRLIIAPCAATCVMSIKKKKKNSLAQITKHKILSFQSLNNPRNHDTFLISRCPIYPDVAVLSILVYGPIPSSPSVGVISSF